MKIIEGRIKETSINWKVNIQKHSQQCQISIVEKTNKTDMSLLGINKEEREVTNYNYQE